MQFILLTRRYRGDTIPDTKPDQSAQSVRVLSATARLLRQNLEREVTAHPPADGKGEPQPDDRVDDRHLI